MRLYPFLPLWLSLSPTVTEEIIAVLVSEIEVAGNMAYQCWAIVLLQGAKLLV